MVLQCAGFYFRTQLKVPAKFDRLPVPDLQRFQRTLKMLHSLTAYDFYDADHDGLRGIPAEQRQRH